MASLRLLGPNVWEDRDNPVTLGPPPDVRELDAWRDLGRAHRGAAYLVRRPLLAQLPERRPDLCLTTANSRSRKCGFVRMLGGPSSGTLLPVTANTIQLLIVTGLTLIAGLTMVVAGTQKKLLRWKKPPPKRCATCGRTDRYNCPCRR
jgi:hypothetical protein